MPQVFEYLIAIGSNLGDRLQNLHRSLSLIETRCGNITARSSFYRTAPVGAADQEFINGAIILESELVPQDLMMTLLAIEQSLGRTREVHWGNRTIDLDLVLARIKTSSEESHSTPIPGNSIVIESESLVVPHPRMLERDFVLVPAAEIAPEWIHPETGSTLNNENKTRYPGGLSLASSLL